MFDLSRELSAASSGVDVADCLGLAIVDGLALGVATVSDGVGVGALEGVVSGPFV